MGQWFAIALGGAAGALLRHGLSALPNNEQFPFGTLLVNLLGSLLIGILYELTERSIVSAEIRPLLMTGTLGALTTFSTHSLDNLQLIESGNPLLALLNIVASISLGLLLAYSGVTAVRLLFPV